MWSPCKKARINRELTQFDVAMQTGIPQWRVSLIERGIIPNPNEMEKLASVLGRGADELFPERGCEA